MTDGSMAPEEVERGFQSLVEHLRDGPLQSLIELQERAEAMTCEQPSREALIEALESLVSLSLCAMRQFHGFNAELQRLVDRLANEPGQRPGDEPADRSKLN